MKTPSREEEGSEGGRGGREVSGARRWLSVPLVLNALLKSAERAQRRGAWGRALLREDVGLHLGPSARHHPSLRAGREQAANECLRPSMSPPSVA